jgi:SAM-dependent methyltransferase
VSDPNAYYGCGLAVAAYDALVGDGGPLAGDVAFYLDCAGRFGGPVLELGVGTGRVLVPVAKAGYEVVGVDLSPAMLQMARANVRKEPGIAGRVQLIEADMRDVSLGRRFALVLVPARACSLPAAPASAAARESRCVPLQGRA